MYTGNGIGDVCEDDFDGDGAENKVDFAPHNRLLSKIDFSRYIMVNLDPRGPYKSPQWKPDIYVRMFMCTYVRIYSGTLI